MLIRSFSYHIEYKRFLWSKKQTVKGFSWIGGTQEYVINSAFAMIPTNVIIKRITIEGFNASNQSIFYTNLIQK